MQMPGAPGAVDTFCIRKRADGMKPRSCKKPNLDVSPTVSLSATTRMPRVVKPPAGSKRKCDLSPLNNRAYKLKKGLNERPPAQTAPLSPDLGMIFGRLPMHIFVLLFFLV